MKKKYKYIWEECFWNFTDSDYMEFKIEEGWELVAVVVGLFYRKEYCWRYPLN